MYYLLKKIFSWLAWAQIRRYKPIIIGITGNVGKTSTKEAIAAVLRHKKSVRVAAGNLNNEFGFALTILGDWDKEYYERGSSASLWLRVFLAGCRGLFSCRDFAEIFLLEYGADHPNDIKNLSKLFKPHIAVITAIGDTPVHVEFFKDAGALTEEKANLVKVLTAADYAVLNNDDTRVMSMKSKTKAIVTTYGFDEGSIVNIFDFSYIKTDGGIRGVSFNLRKSSNNVSVHMYGSLGKSQAYAAAAAAAIGDILGINLAEIGETLGKYQGSNGRLKIISGINGSTVIDDTYNASPSSTRLALETLRDVPASRKIAVLGDMFELGEYSDKAHYDIGLMTGSCADILVCVGSLAKLIAEESKISANRIFLFNTSDEAKSKVRDLITKGDLILIKGSQGMRMEKIVAEIMAEPRRSKELLARQSRNWLSKS